MLFILHSEEDECCSSCTLRRVNDFSIVQVHFVFCYLNFIVLFLYLVKYYHIMFINVVFLIRILQAVETYFFCVSALLLSMLTPLFLPSSSVSWSYFILAVSMLECLGKHQCMNFQFPIAILNGTFSFSRGEIVCLVQTLRVSKSY